MCTCFPLSLPLSLHFFHLAPPGLQNYFFFYSYIGVLLTTPGSQPPPPVSDFFFIIIIIIRGVYIILYSYKKTPTIFFWPLYYW